MCAKNFTWFIAAVLLLSLRQQASGQGVDQGAIPAFAGDLQNYITALSRVRLKYTEDIDKLQPVFIRKDGSSQDYIPKVPDTMFLRFVKNLCSIQSLPPEGRLECSVIRSGNQYIHDIEKVSLAPDMPGRRTTLAGDGSLYLTSDWTQKTAGWSAAPRASYTNFLALVTQMRQNPIDVKALGAPSLLTFLRGALEAGSETTLQHSGEETAVSVVSPLAVPSKEPFKLKTTIRWSRRLKGLLGVTYTVFDPRTADSVVLFDLKCADHRMSQNGIAIPWSVSYTELVNHSLSVAEQKLFAGGTMSREEKWAVLLQQKKHTLTLSEFHEHNITNILQEFTLPAGTRFFDMLSNQTNTFAEPVKPFAKE